MSKDDKSSFTRLWSGGDSSPARRESDRVYQPDEKVVPLTKPAAPLRDREYKAFEIRDHPTRLQIMRAADPARSPNYSYLLDISYDHHKWSGFTLIYTFMIVEVTGWHLEEVIYAINSGNCDRIREFHPKLHDAPGKGEPLIEKIHITTADEKLK